MNNSGSRRDWQERVSTNPDKVVADHMQKQRLPNWFGKALYILALVIGLSLLVAALFIIIYFAVNPNEITNVTNQFHLQWNGFNPLQWILDTFVR